MPPDALGLSGTLYLYRDAVRLVAGRFEARHPRLTEPNAISTLPEHRTQLVAAVSGKRGKGGDRPRFASHHPFEG